MPPLSVRVIKRSIDLVGSSLGLALTLPLTPFIAAAICLESRGGAFFKQQRAKGLALGVPEVHGRPVCSEFTLYKFRTMRDGAEKGTGAVLATENDPRATRVGRWLRKTRLDELPQLWNVLVGDMSLVGPRPERPELVQKYALVIPFFEERMREVKPGLTGLAQINLGYTGGIKENSPLARLRDTIQNPYDLEEARGALADDVRAKLLYDLAYAAALESLPVFIKTELSILLRTPFIMLSASGH